ncbi:MAG: penicillin-binding protein 2 [Hyphomicrobium sp.]
MFADRDDETAGRARFTRRMALLGGLQAAALTAVGWRYFQVQVLDSGLYAPLAESNRIALQVLAPKRGRILDRTGRVIADNDETFRAAITPALAGDVAAALWAASAVLPLSEEDIEKIIRRTKKQSRNVPAVIADDLTFEQVARLNVLAPELPGVRTDVVWRRRYAEGAAVGHVVGYVGPVDRIGIDDDAAMRLPEARIGKSGAEAALETELRGAGGVQRIEVDARGRTVRDLDLTAAANGRDVNLAIDVELQRRVLARLQRERRAACVVLDVETGEVVVMASTPGYDPGAIVDGISEDAWRKLVESEEKPLLNRAVSGQYPPGSTFKMATALAALKRGVVRLNEQISCDGSFEFRALTFRCWRRSGHGPMTLHEALRSSCDAYFFELARRAGIDALADAARQLGLGQTYDGGLPRQKPGLIPDPNWKRGKWNTGWHGGETILAGIGQGYVLATPLQLAVMTARLASGRQVAPTLMRAEAGVAASAFANLPFESKHLEAVRSAMVAVVNEDGGTGVNAQLNGGPQIAGKTGTSQVSRASTDARTEDLAWRDRDHALFVGYLPAHSPRYAAAAVVEHGGGGGSTAAPLVRDVLGLVWDQASAGASAPPSSGREG